MKLLKVLTLAVCLSVSALANATLMLTDNDYITVDHNGIDLDWAWVSNFNVQYYYQDGVLLNEFYAPTAITGWRLANTSESDFFKANITLLNFQNNETGDYKNAIRFFNSNVDTGYSLSDFEIGNIAFDYHENVIADAVFNYYDYATHDTFYVRNSLPQAPAPKPIPEPFTITLFAIALIALQIKMSKKSA
ncbi:hypothetical protein CMT41_15995 [Colwellia sp. MT41]|uniref:hypothetical protein n=1 Tax=Colwellia sp. MT41 TaxID=58049 RepID=UPI000717641D|nr:hypothetical protein [Colwellia sp. MT41]ALO36060.1 hypothetical protein CMT41_15995 [Colwellia sp. MT41]